MKTKEEIIAVIEKIKSLNIALSVADYEAVLHYLKLSTLNPNKIDEERMIGIWNNYPFSYNYGISGMSEMIKQYNSTLKDHQVLQPLPSEMPSFFNETPYRSDLWRELVRLFGTPTKKELVSVEKLDEEICALHRVIMPATSKLIAQHIIDTYSLNPPKSDEFPFNLKKGDKFMGGGREFILEKLETTPRLYTRTGYFEVTDCTPYHEPSIHDKFMASLSDEQKKMYEEIKESTK